MNLMDCLNILREIKDVSFATVDQEGNPQARIIDIMIVEDEKLYFTTARGKDFYREINRNPNVAIIGMNKNYQAVRLNGKVEPLSEHKVWMDRIFTENPSLEMIYPGESRQILEPFYIREGDIEFLDLSKEPIHRESFTFGKTIQHQKGFFITDRCIACNKCKTNCPQQCIKKDKPYVIVQQHCIHCGLCYELCPVQAIERYEVSKLV